MEQQNVDQNKTAEHNAAAETAKKARAETEQDGICKLILRFAKQTDEMGKLQRSKMNRVQVGIFNMLLHQR